MKKKKKYSATVVIDGQEVTFESDILPLAGKEHDCGPVPIVKFQPTQEIGTWKVKVHTREEAMECFRRMNTHDEPKAVEEEKVDDFISKIMDTMDDEPLKEEDFPEELKAVFAISNKVRRFHGDGKDWQGIYKCPLCGKKLHVSIAGCNGHVHGGCETDGCLAWAQ